LNYDPSTLKYLIDSFGYEKVVMGSDYPFLLREIPPGKVIDDTVELTKEQRMAILGKNALDFLNIKVKEVAKR
jgi:aminocarboxymuconate-semialdehyde decarboxylase